MVRTFMQLLVFCVCWNFCAVPAQLQHSWTLPPCSRKFVAFVKEHPYIILGAFCVGVYAWQLIYEKKLHNKITRLKKEWREIEPIDDASLTPQALFERGEHYEIRGDGLIRHHFYDDDPQFGKKQQEEALRCYTLAADQGYAEAQEHLGYCYRYGSCGLQKDEKRAIDFYQRAAAQGSLKAQYSLAEIYRMQSDYIKAITLYEQVAAKKNYGDVYGHLAVCYQFVNNYQKAIEWFQRAIDADPKDYLSQTWLANLYREGQGVQQDHVRALALYQRAAEQNFSEAQFWLAHYYRTGQVVEQDISKAITLYESVLAHKNSCKAFKALQALAAIYLEEHDGVRRNVEKVLRYTLQSADAAFTHTGALYAILYVIFSRGICVQKDGQKAEMYLKKIGQRDAQQLYLSCNDVVQYLALFFQPGIKIDCKGDLCGICQDETVPFASGDTIGILPCGHAFCTNCITQWRAQQQTCPLCRTPAQRQVEGTVL